MEKEKVAALRTRIYVGVLAVTAFLVFSLRSVLPLLHQGSQHSLVDSGQEYVFAPTHVAEEDIVHVVAEAGDYHKPLIDFVDYAGIEEVSLADASEANVADTAAVIGIVVAGQAYAFASNSMRMPTTHIVNLTIQDRPISVTYCPLVDCARVLTRSVHDKRIDLRVGGLDIDGQMVVLLDGVRYGQSSNDIPLADHPFEIMDFKSWKQRYPSTSLLLNRIQL